MTLEERIQERIRARIARRKLAEPSPILTQGRPVKDPIFSGPSPSAASVLEEDTEARIQRILSGQAPDTLEPVEVRETTGLQRILDDAAEGTGALNPIRALGPLYRGGKVAAKFAHESFTKPLAQAVSPLIGSQDMRKAPIFLEPGDPQVPTEIATAETGGVTPQEKISGLATTGVNLLWPGAQRGLTSLAVGELGRGMGARVAGSAATGAAMMGGHGAIEGAIEPAADPLERFGNIVERGAQGAAMGTAMGASMHFAIEGMPATARLAARAAKKGKEKTTALLEDFSLDPARFQENRAMRGIFEGLDEDLAIGHRAPAVHPWEGVRSPRPAVLEPRERQPLSASERGMPAASSSSAESSMDLPSSVSPSIERGASVHDPSLQISGTALPERSTTRTIAEGDPGILAGAESKDLIPRNIPRSEAEVTLPELSDPEYHALRRGNARELVEAWAARVQRQPGQHRLGPGPTIDPIQPTDNPEELIELGRGVFPVYRQDLEEVAQETGVRFFGARHKTLNPDGTINEKGAARFRQKVTNGEAAGWSTKYQGDVVGGRILIDTADEAERVLEALEARGYKQQEIDDFLTPEVESARGGYRAIHVQLRSPQGMSVELQLMPREMSLAQEHPFGHKIYEALRDPAAHPSSYEYQQMKRTARKHYQVAYQSWRRRVNRDPSLDPPVEPEAVAQAVPEAARGFAPGRTTGPAFEVPTSELHLDPDRFQFKQDVDRATGAGTGISGARKYDPDLAGTLDVWRDPENGKLYVVNGHHRHNLAKRDGAPTEQVREINAPDARSARTFGAVINIAEGRGTALDVAKFIKDSGLGIEGLAARNVNVKAGLAREGTALAKLPDDLISKVTRDPELLRKAVVIGEILESPEQQRAAFKVIETKKLSEREVAELAKVIRSAGSEDVAIDDLFGESSMAKSLFVEKAKVASAVRDRLAKDKRLFGYVADESRATELERGGNRIDTARSREIATRSAQLEELFERLYQRGGRLGEIMDGAARRVAKGEKPSTVASSIYDDIQEAVQAELRPQLRRAGAVGEQPPEGWSPDRWEHYQAGRLRAGDIPPDFTPPPEAQKFLELSAIRDRLYHGSGSDITQFRGEGRPIWAAAQPRKAAVYANEAGGNPRTYPVYMNIERPLRVPFDMNKTISLRQLEDALGAKVGAREWFRDSPDRKAFTFEFVNTREFADWARKAGYDGIHALEEGGETWASLYPEKVKSATGNRGTFDSRTRDLSGRVGSGNESAGAMLGSMSGSGLGSAAGGVAGGQIGDTPKERRRNAQIGAALGFAGGAGAGFALGRGAFKNFAPMLEAGVRNAKNVARAPGSEDLIPKMVSAGLGLGDEGSAVAKTAIAAARNAPALRTAAKAAAGRAREIMAGPGDRPPARTFNLQASEKRITLKLEGQPNPDQLNEIITAVRSNPGASFRYSLRDRTGRPVSGGTSIVDLFADQRFGNSVKPLEGARIGAVGDFGEDLFGAPTGPSQSSLFGEEAGRASQGAKPSGAFTAKQAEAKANVEFLRKQLARIADPKARAKVAAQVAELEKIANFNEKITAPELAARAATQEPEKIRIAASRVRDQVFEGEVHAVARQKAIDAGAVSEYYGHRTGEPDLPVEDGFLTTRGRFVSRGEAQRIAEKADQVEKLPEYLSWGTEEGAELEAERFNLERMRRGRNRTGAIGDQPARGAYKGESDLLNISKIVDDAEPAERIAQAAEKYRGMKEGQKQTWAEADVEVQKAVKEILAHDPKAKAPHLAKKLTGVQILARRDVIRQNDELIEGLSKRISSGTLTAAEHEQATQLLTKAVEHNDILLKDIITGASQKGRDLNLLRRISNKTLEHDVWQIQAKRMLGDRPLTDELAAQLRKLVNEAKEVCGG